MGCCGSKSTYGIDPEQAGSAISGLRGKYGSKVLIMGVKDQNTPGKLCLAGDVEQALTDELLKVANTNGKVVVEKDKYDMMWDVVFRNTELTSGHSTFSLAKSYFPKSQVFVKILDTIAGFGWGLAACPNFGGVESRDDKGNVTSTVDWPIFVFYKDGQSQYTQEHMMFAVKDSNVPGKLCASGPIGEMEGKMAEALQGFTKDAKSEKDDYDKDHDVVWRNTSLTSGHSMTSFAKAYFPKGKTWVAVLECAYSFGWRAVAAPNWGGQGDSWPSIIFRKLKDTSEPPEILFASVKDSNIPGKFCVAGRSAKAVVDALCGGLRSVEGNGEVKAEKDSYDEDYDEVCRDIKLTNGLAAFSFALPYFPRSDSMNAVLATMAQQSFQVVACPNFGGMLDSWPTFIFEKRSRVNAQMYLAVKDDNIPGKLCLGGGNIGSDATVAGELLNVLQTLCGETVTQTKDDYDKNFDFCFKNTTITTGHATFTWSKPYWPHGYVVEAVLQVLLNHGYRAEGGPNFGDNGNQWPGIIFQKIQESE